MGLINFDSRFIENFCALKKTIASKVFLTQNTKEACNCTPDTVGSTLPVTIAILIEDSPDKQTRCIYQLHGVR
jgi:hypothetical protein